MTYKVSYQDFRGWREAMHQPMPEIKVEIHDTKEAAEAAKRELQYLGMTACVTEVPLPKAKARSSLPEPVEIGKSRFNKFWRLAR